VSANFKLLIISMLLIVGLAACGKTGTTATTASKTPPTLDQHALNLIAQIKAKAKNIDVTGGRWSVGDGVEIAPRVEFIYSTNRFGEDPYCNVFFKGIDAHDRSEAIPKWGLSLYTYKSSGVQFLQSTSFFGSNNSIRIIFDDAGSPIELAQPVDDYMILVTHNKDHPVNANAMDRFMRAKQVTLFHGMAGTRKIEYIFDTSSFPLAVQLSNALCLM
jgi:hypothetical protein